MILRNGVSKERIHNGLHGKRGHRLLLVCARAHVFRYHVKSRIKIRIYLLFYFSKIHFYKGVSTPSRLERPTSIVEVDSRNTFTNPVRV